MVSFYQNKNAALYRSYRLKSATKILSSIGIQPWTGLQWFFGMLQKEKFLAGAKKLNPDNLQDMIEKFRRSGKAGQSNNYLEPEP